MLCVKLLIWRQILQIWFIWWYFKKNKVIIFISILTLATLNQEVVLFAKGNGFLICIVFMGEWCLNPRSLVVLTASGLSSSGLIFDISNAWRFMELNKVYFCIKWWSSNDSLVELFFPIKIMLLSSFQKENINLIHRSISIVSIFQRTFSHCFDVYPLLDWMYERWQINS